MKKSIVILDPFPRTLDLMFSKEKLKILKSKYKTITAPKKNKKNFMKKLFIKLHLSWVNLIWIKSF